VNRRERMLLGLVAGVVGLLVVGFGLRAVFMRPLNELDKQITSLKLDLKKMTDERRAYFAEEDKVKGYAQRTFSDDVDKASAKSGEMITKLLLISGLPESDFSRLPVGPRKVRGASELGWNVQGDGPLMQVVNLLFLLQTSPYLHRVENMTVTPADRPGRVRVRFRFLTLVLEPAPTIQWKEPAPTLTLESPERRSLDMIVQRDLLRPYIKRQPVPPAGRGRSPNAVAASETPLPGPESLRVVSLSEWQGVAETHVLDTVNNRTLVYRLGDDFAGGRLVTVDYRPMPFPDKPYLRSDSRVIIRIGSEYWAIERGRTLADKHRLLSEQLPEGVLRQNP
jgi:hypothetical protein